MNSFALPRCVRRGFFPATVIAFAAAFVTQPAVADEYDTFNVTLGSTLRHDANVFKTADSSAPPAGFSTKSDYITDYHVGLRIDKPYMQQRLQAEVKETRTTYNTFSYLDADALNYRAAWLWALTYRWTGTLAIDRAQAQVPFATAGGTQKNQRTTNNRNFTLDGWLFGGWHLLGGYGESDSETQQTLLGSPSFQNHHSEGGLRYVAESGNSITFMQRWTPADLVNQALDPVNLIDTNYTDKESDLKASWSRGKSTLNGNVTYKTRTNEHFVQRNFSGTAGELRYGWAPTGKLKFNVAAARTFMPYFAYGNTVENANNRVGRTLTLGAEWAAEPKLTFRLSLARTLTDFRGPVFAPSPGQHTNDGLNVAQLSLAWTPARYMTVNASVGRQQRTSNLAQYEFNDTTATIDASLNF